jgi:hypothetical protein
MDILSIFYLTMEELSILLLPTNPGTPPGQREEPMTPATLHLPPDATAAHAGPNVVGYSLRYAGLCPKETRLAAARALMQPDAGWDGVNPRHLQTACDMLRQMGSPADAALADAAGPHITAHRLRWESENPFPRIAVALVFFVGFIAFMFFTLAAQP